MTELAPAERAGPTRPDPPRFDRYTTNELRTWRSGRCVVVALCRAPLTQRATRYVARCVHPMKDRWARDIHTISLVVWGGAILAASSELAWPFPLRSIDRDTTNKLRTWSKLGVVVVPLRLRVAFSLRICGV